MSQATLNLSLCMKSWSMTIQMKPDVLYGQYFPVVLFIMFYKVVLNLTLCMKSLSVTIHNESYCGTLLQWYVAKGFSDTTRVHPWETFVIENCFW